MDRTDLTLAIEGEGHRSEVLLAEEVAAYLGTLVRESCQNCAPTFAHAAAAAIERAREAWEAEGEQDGPGG